MNDITITPTDDTEIEELVLDSVEIASIADTAKQADTEIEEIVELELTEPTALPTKPKKTLAINHKRNAKSAIISHSAPLAYADISATVKQEVEEVAERIRSRLKGSIIDTGVDLIEVKDKLRHGGFGEWLEIHFGWSPRTAENYMSAARAFQKTPKVVEFLPPTTVYRLAAKSTPENVRADIVKKIVAGKITRSEVEGRLKKQAPSTAQQHQPPADQAKRAKVAGELLVLMKKRMGAEYPRFRNLMMKVDITALRDAIVADKGAATVPVVVAGDVQGEAA